MKIIQIKDINIIQDYFKNYKHTIIFGKGPTFKILNKNDFKDTAFICINDTINYIDNCDLLVCNDIESFTKINLEKLKECKNILIPYHIHQKCLFNKNITFNNVIDIIKNYFTGNLIIYNLKSSNKKYSDYINLNATLTSSHTAFEFIGKFIKNINIVDFYGVCINTTNDKAIFYNKPNDINHIFHTNRINLAIQRLNLISKNLKIKYILH